MNYRCQRIALILCMLCNQLFAQHTVEKKQSFFAFNVHLTDYNFFYKTKGSSINAFQHNNLFKAGYNSFGISVAYWKGLTSHINLSGNLGGTFSNYPGQFIKDDSIGQSGFSTQLDALLHFMALNETSKLNPYLSGGLGVGNFGKTIAVYAPIGLGLKFHFNGGGNVFLQSQIRIKLSSGINKNFMLFSVGFAQSPKFGKDAKKKKSKTKLPAKSKTDKEKAIKEIDSDGDGFADSIDKCPTEKGNVNGCPDTDGDGIADKDDQCKDIAGVARYNGCPVPDTDGDGIDDENDRCKTEKGDKDNYGCPWPDMDADGVPDKDDKCPAVKGTLENNGCPLPVADGAPIINVTKNSMTYCINFDYDRAILLTDAFNVLKNIVDILKADNSLQISITGHSDNGGTNAGNLRVSADRAKITKDYFLSYNIAESRIQTAFYGSSKPIDNEQQWRNRRVEITIIKKQ